MGNITKGAAFLLTLLAAVLAVSFVAPASAQAATEQPSTPQFTVELSGPAFDIPPTYTFNPSTGLFDANDGYHFQYSVVNVVIQNQPFTNQSNYDFLYYNVRIKPQNYVDSYWNELFHAGADGYPIQTSGNTTVIPIAIEGTQASGILIGAGDSTDIQVEAMIGHVGRNQTFPYEYIFYGEVSDWSSTQTVAVPPKTPYPASLPPSASSTPAATSNAGLDTKITLPLSVFVAVISGLTLIVIALAVVIRLRTRKTV